MQQTQEQRRKGRGTQRFPTGYAYCRFMAFPINGREDEDEVEEDDENSDRHKAF